ncbi:glycosyltransferase family 2 protein [Pectobacterium aroidearum]|uniref:glycosyltransferase family 2 protein n=1 Tax=Pectobacterium aroidearum TaxID=1201031 RepID=UPI0015DDD199|nr:glycosyltransferase family A protein [Pectobacterium aroidearum]MBA0205332.1 glycosyltransferase family 2 protein [Pectobacterium aroidearum]
MKVTIIIPTLNGGQLWHQVCDSLSMQNKNAFDVLVLDSSSSDDTAEISKKYGFKVEVIQRKNFNHGGTRNLGVSFLKNTDIVIFLTQDSLPEAECIRNISSIFDCDEKIAVAYGRQLPHDDANPLAAHARYYNYNKESFFSEYIDKEKYGIKTVFTSNSFAAYRVEYFKKLGGFPTKTILSEDMYFAAKAIMAGYKTAYVSDAIVKHSHNYTPIEEFKRYFDIGVFHCDEEWIRINFGGAGGEGFKFIISEFKYLIKNHPLWIPRACVHNFFKICGYKIGKKYKLLPKSIVKKISMHSKYWVSE